MCNEDLTNKVERLEKEVAELNEYIHKLKTNHQAIIFQLEDEYKSLREEIKGTTFEHDMGKLNK